MLYSYHEIYKSCTEQKETSYKSGGAAHYTQWNATDILNEKHLDKRRLTATTRCWRGRLALKKGDVMNRRLVDSLVSSLVRVVCMYTRSVVVRSWGSLGYEPNGVYLYTYVCLTFWLTPEYDMYLPLQDKDRAIHNESLPISFLQIMVQRQAILVVPLWANTQCLLQSNSYIGKDIFCLLNQICNDVNTIGQSADRKCSHS